jgi:hypothetical protein
VTDPNGALLPGATVIATSKQTGLSKTTTTNGEGRYTITLLEPGEYTITVEASGFAKSTRDRINLEVAQTAQLNFSMSITAEATVEINDATTPLLVTESSGLESTVENKLVEELPSAERNSLAFVNLVPGTIDQGFAQGRGEALNENGNAQGPIGSPGNRNFFDSGFSLNGGRSSTNDVLIDGVPATIGDFNGVAVATTQDSVREFKVISGAYSAEFGRSGGGVVLYATKSGGNKFHGSLYEYFQNGGLNANGWQRNRRGVLANGSLVLPRIAIKRNQFGGSFSGPFVVPNFGEGGPSLKTVKNTFFFFIYEGRRERNPFSRELTLPTARMRRGDLSELLGTPRTGITNGDGTPALFGQVYNPYAALQGANRPYFAGNRLDTLPVCNPGPRTAACLDPVALRTLQFLPLPNTPGLVNNFVFSQTAIFKRDIVALRVDHTVSDRQSFSARFTIEDRFQAEPNFFDSPAANVRKVADVFGNFVLNHTFSFTPTFFNNARYGYTRARAHQTPESEGFDPTQLGFPTYLRDSASILKFPDFTIGGGSQGQTLAGEITSGQIGGAGNNQPRDTHTIADTMTWIRGNHTFKFGGEYRLYRFYPFQFFTPTGSFTFNRTWTRGPNPTANPSPVDAAGSSLASFLLGLPAAASKETVTPVTIFHDYWAAFFQDDWKFRPNLTLNLGLRWDLETGTEETHGLITNFDSTAASPIAGSSLIVPNFDPFVLSVRPNFAQNKGLLSFVDGPQVATNKNRFAPRVGFAYSINSKMTVRAGYGLTYVPLSLEVPAAQGNNFTTSIVQSSQTGLATSASTIYLNNPFPSGFPPVPGASLGSRTLLGSSIIAVEPERKNAYTQQWNIVFQRELARNLALDIAYVGSRGVRLPIQSVNFNQLEPAILNRVKVAAAAAGQSTSTFLNAAVPNPFLGVINAPGYTGTTIQRRLLLNPFPQYTAVTLFRPHWGKSTYHSMQVNLQKRFSDGLSATVNYTWSKALDTGGVGNGAAFLDPTAIQDIYNFNAEYSLSTLDVPHRIYAAWSYDLPFGKKKRFGKSWNSFVNGILGGWQVSGSYNWQTGTPIPITVAAFSVGVGNAVYRPNRVPGDASFSIGDARNRVRNGQSWFDTTLFIVPPDFTLGSAARTYSDVRRDNYRNLNVSLLKNWYWADGRQKLQFRSEFLNAFNMVVFGTPGSNASVPANSTQTGFGQIRTQGNTPRIIQFVLRYTF